MQAETGASTTVHVVLDVNGYFKEGEPPVAVDDSYAAEKDTTLNVSAAAGVTSNDTLNGASIASYGATTGTEQTTIGAATPTSAGGSIALNANGSFSYTPPSGAVLIDDTFKYILQNSSGSSTATVTISVGKASQTISFTSTAPSDAKVGGPTYNVTATATSGLPVTFTIDATATSVCSISGSTVSFLAVGTCVINANQPGDANYQPAPQEQQTFAVAKGDQTITFTSSAPASAKVGGPTYNVTATATSTLPVTFTIDASAASICSISGSTVSFLAVGTCVINADQIGDANWNPAPQVQQTFPVGKGDQTISFTSTAPSDAAVNGPTYNVTATATSGLVVTFTIDASATSVCSIAGSTVSFIGGGTCVINADQAGDANWNAAPQVQQSFPVAKQDQTITFTSSPPAGATVAGPTYTVTATATSGLPVTFTIDASAASVCSISGSTVSFIGAGTCVINANQAGNGAYNPAPQVQQSFPVVKQDQTITFTSTPPAFATVGGPTYTVTATATSGLPVTFTIDASASAVCSIAGSTVSFTAGGTCLINANQAGNGTYNPAPQVQQSVTVNFPPQLVGSPKESFETIGNTQLEFKAAQALSPSVFVSGNLVANFTDSDGPSALSAVPVTGGATANGGIVDIASNGEFTFTPKAGDTAASDSFGYQVTDGAYTVNRTVTVNRKERVWYVKNNAPAGGLGRSSDPFDTLAEAQTASSANDYIFVYFGNGTTTGQAGGIALKNGQHLIGEFAGLTITFNPAITFNGVAGTTSVPLVAQPLPTACSGNPCRPMLDDTVVGAPEGVAATGVIPVEIIGLNLAGNVNAIDWNTAAAFSGTGTLTIRDNVVRSAGAEGVDINLAGTGATNLSFHDNNLTATGAGLDIFESGTGTLTITAFDDNVVSGNTGGTGINISTATFDSTPGGGLNTVDGGTTVIGAAGNGVGGAGLVLTNVQGDLHFSTNLNIFADGGAGLSVSGTGAGMQVRVDSASAPAAVGIIETTGGPAIDALVVGLDLRLTSLKSTNSATTGVSLTNVTGTLSAESGSSITDASGIDFNISGGTANVTYKGTITDDVGQLVSIASTTGGTKSFTGAITDGGDGDGSGISLTNNTGATISFSGGVVLSTGSNPAFTATGPGPLATSGGTVIVTGSANTLQTTTATALNVAHTTIGASGLTFRSISSGVAGGSGPANGINLNNTGALGGLTVSGNGGVCTYATPTCSGGTIQSSTSDAVKLVSTQNVSLTRMRIHDNDTNGIYGDELTNFTLANSVVSDNDVANPGAFEAGVKFNELYGTNSITDTVVRGTKGDNIRVEMSSGTLTSLTLTNATVGPTANVGGGYSNGFSIVTTGNPTLNVTVTNSLFTGVDSSKQQSSGILTSIGGGTTRLTVTGSDFEQENIGIDLGSSSTGIHKFNIDNNDLVFHRTNAVNIVGSSVIDGTVNNNRVGNGTVDSGSMNSFGIAASHRGNSTWFLALTNNVVKNTDFEGIFVRTGDLLAGDSGTVNLTLTGNTVFTPDDNSGFPANPKGMHLRSRQATILCMNVANNEAQGNGAAGYHLQESDTSQLRFQGFNTNAVTTLTAKGNTTAGGAPTTNEVGAPFAGACTPTLPSFP